MKSSTLSMKTSRLSCVRTMSEKLPDPSQPPTEIKTVREGFSFLSAARVARFAGSEGSSVAIFPPLMSAKAKLIRVSLLAATSPGWSREFWGKTYATITRSDDFAEASANRADPAHAKINPRVPMAYLAEPSEKSKPGLLSHRGKRARSFNSDSHGMTALERTEPQISAE